MTSTVSPHDTDLITECLKAWYPYTEFTDEDREGMADVIALVRQSDERASLRDDFAKYAISCIPLRSWDHVGDDDFARIKAWAKCAYLVADAMLEAREASNG